MSDTPTPSGSPGVMRHLNRNNVLKALRSGGPTRRSELARLTGLSRPTVYEVVAGLKAEGLVSLTFATSSTGRGPRSMEVTFNALSGRVMGLDIGATKAVIFLADLQGQLRATHRIDTTGAKSRDELLGLLRSGITEILSEDDVTFDQITSVGVGTPGVVDPSTGAISLAPQLPGWDGIVLARELDPRITAPVQAVNEVHLAVLGERWVGAAQDVRDAVYFDVGVGIGLGILIDGHLHLGNAGAAGEIGYLPLAGEELRHPAGVGSLEHAASGAAFARIGRDAAREPGGRQILELAGGDPDRVNAEIVFAAARDGDPIAQKIVNELVGLLARAAASVCLVLNPAIIILGGGLSQAGGALATPLEAQIREKVPFPPQFRLSMLGDVASAHGAVRLALDMYDTHLYQINPDDPAQP